MLTRHSSFIILCFVTALFQGCSGGTLESDTDTPASDVFVNVGSNQTVNEQTEVILTGDATGQTDTLTYAWTATPEIAITHEDTSLATATFTTPTTVETLTYTLTLVVTDEQGNSASDSVEYQVEPVNISPVADIALTSFDELNPYQFPAGYTIELNGTASSDSDTTDEGNLIAAYLWQQTAGESVLDNVSTQESTLSFVAPLLLETNTVTLSLTVTDNEGAEDTQTISLTILGTKETLPTVNAGVDHEVFSGESIILNGVASTTVSSSTPLKFTWYSNSEQVLISGSNTINTYAIAPTVSAVETITFTLNVEDALGNQIEDSVSVNVLPLAIQPLNDTGVIQQVTNTSIIISHQADFPGQDGQRGQDIIYFNGLSAKAGRGEQGFDFTALDEIGDEVDDISQESSCVRDNITGLIWEVKEESSSTNLHSSEHSYSWYQVEDNGGYAGDLAGAETSCSLTECNTSAYIAEVNSKGLCNFRDWRLPTHNELLSILHFGQEEAPMIDDEYFPYTTESLGTVVWYWTNRSSADGFANDQAINAWAIDFASGNDNFLNKSTAARIRLVRAGR